MNKTVIIFVLIVLLGFIGLYMATLPKQTNQSTNLQTPATSQAQQNQEQANPTTSANPIPTQDFVSANAGVIKTVKGDIEVAFYPKDASKTVTNFATLAKRGYYNNLNFHRVEPGFVIQGGDPNGNGTGGTSIYGEKFEDELNPNTDSYKEGYKEGVVAMANAGPNTNGSQFFIMLADNPLPHNYTIFGKVTKGMDVVKKIERGDKILSIEVQ